MRSAILSAIVVCGACCAAEVDLSKLTAAVAVVHPTEGNKCMGVVHFTQDGANLKIVADLEGLTPGKHAIHIHEFGDCTSADGMSTGGHYNPEGHHHGAPDAAEHHAGDFGNLTA